MHVNLEGGGGGSSTRDEPTSGGSTDDEETSSGSTTTGTGSSRTTTLTRGTRPSSGGSSSGGSDDDSSPSVRERFSSVIDGSSTPGRVATAVGTVGEEIADTPVGRSVGSGFDAAFGESMSDRGALGGVDDRLESAEERFQEGVADRIESAPVEDQFERFGRDVTAQTASFLNPAGIARDALTVTEAGGRGVQTVTSGPESVQSAGETTADVARASPDLARSGADYARENPRDVAVTGTAIVATGGVGALGVRGARAARSAVSGSDGPDLSSFVTDTRATTTGRQRGERDTSETVDFGGAQSQRDFEADLRQEDLTQRQDILGDQARREQQVQRDVIDGVDDTTSPFGSDRGPTFDPDRPAPVGPARPTGEIGQQVPRGFGDIGRADNVPMRDLRSSVRAPAEASGGTTPFGTGAPAGIGIAAVNDPTGISQTGTAGAGSPQDPTRIQGGGATVGDLDAVNDPTGVDPTGDVESDPTTTAIDTTGTGTGTTDSTTDPLGDPVGTTEVAVPTQPAGTDPGVDPVGDVGLGLDIEATTRAGVRPVSRPATQTSGIGDTTASTGTTGSPPTTTGRPPRRVPTLPDPDDDLPEDEFGLFDSRTDTEDVVEPTRGLDAVDDDIMGGFDGP